MRTESSRSVTLMETNCKYSIHEIVVQIVLYTETRFSRSLDLLALNSDQQELAIYLWDHGEFFPVFVLMNAVLMLYCHEIHIYL